MHVGIDTNGIDAETEIEREVRRLAPDTGESKKSLEVGRHFSPMAIDQNLCDFVKIRRLDPVEAGGKQKLLQFRLVQSEQRLWIGSEREEPL